MTRGGWKKLLAGTSVVVVIIIMIIIVITMIVVVVVVVVVLLLFLSGCVQYAHATTRGCTSTHVCLLHKHTPGTWNPTYVSRERVTSAINQSQKSDNGFMGQMHLCDATQSLPPFVVETVQVQPDSMRPKCLSGPDATIQSLCWQKCRSGTGKGHGTHWIVLVGAWGTRPPTSMLELLL
jgi:flagellar basal body-associated protein FliL